MTKVTWLDRRVAHPGPYLTLALSEAEYKAAFRHLKLAPEGPWIRTPQAHATAHYAVRTDGRQAVVVCLSAWEGRNPIEVAGLLVHEAVHIWQEYAAWVGEIRPGAEQEAYAIQSIAQELMAEFARRLE